MEPELQFSGDYITYGVYIGRRVLEQDESTTTQEFDVSLINIIILRSTLRVLWSHYISVLIIMHFSQETEGSLTIIFPGVPRGLTFIDAYLQVIKTLH